MKLKKQPIPDKYYAILHCDKCGIFLAKFFAACEGCIVEHDFFNKSRGILPLERAFCVSGGSRSLYVRIVIKSEVN